MPTRMRLKAIGYWMSDVQDYLPVPKAGIWNENDRQKAITYLDASPMALTNRAGELCHLCNKEIGGMERTDGIYIWPSSLVHYIKDHCVTLPPYFMQHLKDVNYAVLTEFPSPFSFLPDRDYSLWCPEKLQAHG